MNNVLEKLRLYKNGSRVTPKKNRAVLLHANMVSSEDGHGMVIEFKRADLPKEYLESKTCGQVTYRNKLRVTQVAVSRTSALALYVCLKDFFERVEPNFENQTDSNAKSKP